MATEDTLVKALRRLIPEITRAVLDEPIGLKGTNPDTGRPYTGHTTLRNEAAWGTMRGFRDRRIEAGMVDISDAVRPSTIEDVVRGALAITDQKEA